MRKTIIVVTLAVVVAAAAVAFGVASSTLRRETAGRVTAGAQQIRDQTGLVIESPSVSVELFPPAAVLRGGKIHEKGVPDVFIAESGTIRVFGRLGDLLGGRFVPERIELQGVRLVTTPFVSDKAFALLSALRDIKVPVVLVDCSFRLARDKNTPPFEATKINVRLSPGAVIPFEGTMAALGPSSHAEIRGEWRPGAGRTGGDGLKLDLQVRDGDPEALGRLVPDMRITELRGGLRFDISADGFIGERTTESLPADPLKGRVRAESDVELFGLRRPAVFDSGFTLDDRRWVLENGQGRWDERAFTYAGWIARGFSANKVNLRLNVKDVSVSDLLADYGIAERWRPQAVVTGEIRMAGTLSEPLTRYTADVDGVRFDGWSGVPVSSGPVEVSGSLIAINAEFSGSFTTNQLKIGNLVFDRLLVGSSWWRGKLNVTSIGQSYWDGKLDAAASYTPAESSDVTGGGLLHSVDAKAALGAFFPDLDIGIDGLLDTSVQGGYNTHGFWYDGRFQLRDGAIAKGLVRAVADRVVSAAGGSPAANDALTAAYPALSASRSTLTKVEGAFSVREAPISFEISKVVSDGVNVRATGSLDAGRNIEADAVATFTEPLVRALAQHTPALAKLAAADGSIAAPFHAKGPVNDFLVELDPAFTAALEKARSGAVVEPFAAPAAPEPLKIDVPPLEEQFGE